MGVYPNLGVIDAYATVRRGDRAVHGAHLRRPGRRPHGPAGGPLPDRGARAARAACAWCATATSTASAFDLTWTGSFPVVEEPRPRHAPGRARHPRRPALRPGGDVVGRAAGRRRRDRRRPTTAGSAPATGRGASAPWARPSRPGAAAAEPDDGFGFWWTYVPLRFDDFAVVVIAQEDGDGTRLLNEAVRVCPAALGAPARAARLARVRDPLPPGHPPPRGGRASTCAEPGRRAAHPRDRDPRLRGPQLRRPATAATPTGPTASGGAGAGPRASVVDMSDPAIAGRIPFGVVDHVARATLRRRRGMGDVRARDLRPPRAVGLHRLGVGGARSDGGDDRRRRRPRHHRPPRPRPATATSCTDGW